uniref:Putative U3 small nucleolar RNA-associated protein 11 n=1 Tax=Lygus hesperus TaxID=30085 RepID=A0A146KSP8_LYGHE
MKSAAQRRRERRGLQEKLHAANPTTPEARAALIEQLKMQQERKRCKFSDLGSEARTTSSASLAEINDDDENNSNNNNKNADHNSKGDRHDDEEDDVVQLLQRQREAEEHAAW